MALVKSDFKEIKRIIDDSATETKKALRQEIGQSVEKAVNDSNRELKEYIGKEIGNLAVMTKRGFDSVDNRFAQMDKRFDKLEKGQEQLRKDISNLEFIATEMVRRDEFLELKQRLDRIETKMGLTK